MSQEQVLQSAHLGQEDDLGDSEATGSAVDEKKQAERFIKIIEKPKATAPTKAPEQRPEPAPAPKLVPILPDESLESVLDILDYGLLTTLFEAGSSRPESAAQGARLVAGSLRHARGGRSLHRGSSAGDPGTESIPLAAGREKATVKAA